MSTGQITTGSKLDKMVKEQNRRYDTITAEQIKRLLPKGSSHQVADNVVEAINSVEDTVGLGQQEHNYKFLAHINVLKEGNWSVEQYNEALLFVTTSAYTKNNTEAWQIIKPLEYQRLMDQQESRKAEGKVPINIHAHVSEYNRSDLVVALRTRLALAPSVMLAPVRDEAFGVLTNIMRGIAAPGPDGEPQRVSPNIQMQAASKLVEALAPPEDNSLEIKLGMSDDAKSVQQNVADQMRGISEMMAKQFAEGRSLSSVQKIGVKVNRVVDLEVE
jgi:hypothetical protein